jgi:carbon starvation protein
MITLLIAFASFFGFIIAYHTYGRWLGWRIFQLDPVAVVPSKQLEDGIDFVPSKPSLVFGHHFTSIAGTGPIVGPAVAVFWGWLPALLWVVIGSIFIGAVHDFGALVVSLRNRGQTTGEIAGRMISKRARLLFLLILFFALTVVLAIFGLVIAQIFDLYPESVLAVWISLPIAIFIGYQVRSGATSLRWMSFVPLLLIGLAIYLGAYHLPIRISIPAQLTLQYPVLNPVVIWTIILMIYCAFASVLPVWMLLQPRDYINSHVLYLVMGFLIVGLIVSCLTGQADLIASAPAIAEQVPVGTPPIFPFLFITIACGAVSGFHCLVSSGTSSKQVARETDAHMIGYGSMLLEGALAVIVILACCAGIGMGDLSSAASAADSPTGVAAWRNVYQIENGYRWIDFTPGKTMGAFVEGGANFLYAIGIPIKLGMASIAVLIACFAATTLDSATRLQRYVIEELAESMHLKPLTNRYMATGLAVGSALAIAMLPGKPNALPGTGGFLLWPLFGATNQLLAGLAFLVTAFYLWRRNRPVWFLVLPTLLLIVVPGWGLCWLLFNSQSGFIGGFASGANWVWRWQDNLLLGSIGLITLAMQVWMVVEAFLLWPSAKGVLEPVDPRWAEQDEARQGQAGIRTGAAGTE